MIDDQYIEDTDLRNDFDSTPELKILYENLGRATYKYSKLANELEMLEQLVNTIRNNISELET